VFVQIYDVNNNAMTLEPALTGTAMFWSSRLFASSVPREVLYTGCFGGRDRRTGVNSEAIQEILSGLQQKRELL